MCPKTPIDGISKWKIRFKQFLLPTLQTKLNECRSFSYHTMAVLALSMKMHHSRMSLIPKTHRCRVCPRLQNKETIEIINVGLLARGAATAGRSEVTAWKHQDSLAKMI